MERREKKEKKGDVKRMKRKGKKREGKRRNGKERKKRMESEKKGLDA